MSFLKMSAQTHARAEPPTHQPTNPPTHYLMTHGDEIYAVVIRDANALQEKASKGVEWLDTQRHLLQEYNEVDRHTLPLTGDLIED